MIAYIARPLKPDGNELKNARGEVAGKYFTCDQFIDLELRAHGQDGRTYNIYRNLDGEKTLVRTLALAL